MNRWISLSIKIFVGFIILILITWISGSVYISSNKDKILKTILTQANDQIQGSLTVQSMEPSLLRGFPGVSLTLNNVVVRDSLWQNHKNDLINAKKIHISLNVFSLLTGKTNIQRILINDANITLFTDSTGYTNTSLIKKKDTKTPKTSSSPNLEIRNIDFKNVRFVLNNTLRNKKFDFEVDKVLGKIKYPIGGFKGNIQLKTKVNMFSFNTKRGSFLKDKVLNGTLNFEYNKGKQLLTIDPNNLDIGKDKFVIGALINTKQGGFDISIQAKNILFENIAHLLAPNISSKLLRFGIDKGITVNGNIIDDGSGKSADPLIKVAIVAKNSKVIIPSGQLEKANFIGKFTNQQYKSKPIGDENSVIEFTELSADYYNIPITIDTFLIQNLAQPIAVGRVKSNFNIDKLNKTVESDILDFKSGEVALNLFCKADIENFQFTKPALNGKIEIKKANILYKPTNTSLANNALTLTFNDKDLIFSNSKLQLGKSQLDMNLSIKNFLNIYYDAPEKILVDVKLNSPQIHLNELMPIISPRNKKVAKKKKTNQSNAFTEQLTDILEQSRMNVQINVNKAIYKKFTANNLNANVSIIGTKVLLNNVSISHAGGSLKLNGTVNHVNNRNIFSVNSNINNVNVKEFFYAFENFGQNSITDKNLKGFLSAQVKINGSLSNTGTLAPKSIKGNLTFNLRDAALINFDPMIKAGKFAFANRDFSNIRMKSLDGKLGIDGEKIEISPLEISSSVLNMNVEGQYSMGRGTNLLLDIPLRNPERDAGLSAKERKEQRMKGIVLRLKAIDGDDGKVKIRWNGNRKNRK